MWRPALVVAALLALPASASVSLISLLPADDGGLTAFVAAGTTVFAVPVDSNGVSHPARAVRVFTDLTENNVFDIARTGTGWLMTFSSNGIGYTEPLDASFSPLALPRALGRDWPMPLSCSDGACAFIRQIKRTLVLADATGTPAAELPVDPNWRRLIATNDGFALLWTTRATDTSPFDLHVETIDRAGQITGNSVIATRQDGFAALGVAPHPLGAVVFLGSKTQIDAVVVRTDGTIAAQAAYPTSDLEVAAISAATAGGEIAVGFNTYLQYPSLHFGLGRTAAYAMRLSEFLTVLEGPVRIAPDETDSSIGPVVASGDAFFARWSDASGAHMLRIPLAGPIDPKASVPFDFTPHPRRRSITH
jgi:hypothetical protein